MIKSQPVFGPVDLKRVFAQYTRAVAVKTLRTALIPVIFPIVKDNILLEVWLDSSFLYFLSILTCMHSLTRHADRGRALASRTAGASHRQLTKAGGARCPHAGRRRGELYLSPTVRLLLVLAVTCYDA